MGKIFEFIKKHPIGIAITLSVLVAIYIIMSRRSSSAPSEDYTGYVNGQAQQVQAGTQLQMAQIAANAQSYQLDTQAAIASKALDVETIKAQLSSHDSDVQNTLAAEVAKITAQLSANTQMQASALQAQVSEKQIAAEIESQRINAQAYVTIASLPYTSVTQDLINKVNSTYTSVQTLGTQLTANTTADAAMKSFLESGVISRQRIKGSANYSSNGPGTEYYVNGQWVNNLPSA